MRGESLAGRQKSDEAAGGQARDKNVYNIGKQASKEHMSSNELVKVWNDFYSTL